MPTNQPARHPLSFQQGVEVMVVLPKLIPLRLAPLFHVFHVNIGVVPTAEPAPSTPDAGHNRRRPGGRRRSGRWWGAQTPRNALSQRKGMGTVELHPLVDLGIAAGIGYGEWVLVERLGWSRAKH